MIRGDSGARGGERRGEMCLWGEGVRGGGVGTDVVRQPLEVVGEGGDGGSGIGVKVLKKGKRGRGTLVTFSGPL